MNITMPHVNHNGEFVNTDSRYQLITWTDTYNLLMIAVDKSENEIRHNARGTYEDMNRVYENNRDNCIYAVLSQVRVLGDGTQDLNAVKYKTTGQAVPNGFKFKL